MKKIIEIAGHQISEKTPAYLIAEMSANHLQDYDRAKKIILEAKKAGADAIKLQSYRPDTITINCYGNEFMATKGSIWEGQNLYELYERAYMPWEWHEGLFQYARKLGITIFSSPFDATAVDLLESLGAPAYKIASYEIVDIPLIRKVAKTGKPIIISTGIATLSDIELAINTCKLAGNENVILLKCVSQYPTPFESINLRTIPNMKETFDCLVGLSDHSLGCSVDVAAVALGSKVIEKHLTLRRSDGGPDGQFSMEPEEFKTMVSDIRNVEAALGKSTYELTEKQLNGKKNSRSLYVIEDVQCGEMFTKMNVKSIRPGYGMHPVYYNEILGKRAKCFIKKGTPLAWSLIEFD